MTNKDTISRRILMIAPTPFFADRGCHVRIRGEAQSLIAHGHQLLLCTYGLGRDVDGIPTVRTMNVPWYTKLSPGPSIHKIYVDIMLLWTVIWVSRRFRPDVVHGHLHEGVLIGKIISRLYGVPLVADIQGSLVAELVDHKAVPTWGWWLNLLYKLEKWIVSLPDHAVFSSTYNADNSIEQFRIPKDRVTTLMDGVEIGNHENGQFRNELRKSLSIQPDDRVVVFVGVLTEYQGINLLMQAVPLVLQQMPDAKFLIMGYPNEDVYRKRSEALGVGERVHFTGRIPYDQLSTYLSLGDVAISPKISTSEANQKLLVYMAMGLPTVVFDSRVNREILGDLGIYAKFGETEGLAGSLVEILRDPERRKLIGARSKIRAHKTCSWEVAAAQLSHLYEDQLSTKSADSWKKLNTEYSR